MRRHSYFSKRWLNSLDPAGRPARRLPEGVLFAAIELALAGTGLAMARLYFGPLTGMRVDGSPSALAQAALWSAPALLFAVSATSRRGVRLPGLRGIYAALCEPPLGPFIRDGRPAYFLLLSICAGLAEELLFRAALQPHWGIWVTAIVFGACHALTPAYFGVAVLIGAYLGSAYAASGGNIVVPVVVHTLYDFTALLLYRRRMRADQRNDTMTSSDG